MELGDKTLGIIGLGAIGRLVAKLARGIGMRVLAYDPYVGTTGERYRGALLVSLEELLKESQVVTLHVPRHAETDGLLDAERLALVRPGSFLVNTSSHSAVDEGALVEALHSGRLAGAALDVHESHPIPPTSPLLGLDNVILTPHIGGATDETVSRHSWMIVEAVRRFLAGRRPKHLVNPNVWMVRRGR
jgi:phosphoglycerate dehydrogenase-like enzyme